jgi:hypothetical protein|tara:strand:+ start:91 stop:375 length:285 start_codon:yes stop_codon:yes gene_type:complete
MVNDMVQTYIIRQTCLKASVEMMKEITQSKGGHVRQINDEYTQDIIWLARKFEQYVFKGDVVTDERMKELDNIVADAIAKGDKERKLKEKKNDN